MLTEVKPDIVSVCTPNLYHKDQTIAALECGAHVLCEKPLAGTYADAVAMFGAADAAGKQLMACQSLRFYNNLIAAKEFAESGQLGEVYFAEVMGMRRRGIPTWGQFHMKKHSGAGPVYDLGVHQLDGLYWLIGNPRVVSVSAQTFTKIGNRDEGLKTSLADSGAPLGVLTPRKYDYHEFDVEDMAAGFIRLENGAVVAFKTSWAANISKELFNTNILGTQGGLNLDPFLLSTNMGSYQVDVTPKIPADEDYFFVGHFGATAHFIRLIRGEEEAIVKRDEVLNVMRTLEAIYKSAEEGREIKVAY
jgi:predicted dehydrogenase